MQGDEITDLINELFNAEDFNLEEISMRDLVSAAHLENERLYKRQLRDILGRLCVKLSKDFHLNRVYVMPWVRGARQLMYINCMADMFCKFLSIGVEGDLFSTHLDALQDFAMRGGSDASAHELRKLIDNLRVSMPQNVDEPTKRMDKLHTHIRYNDAMMANAETGFALPTTEGFFETPETNIQELPCVQVDAPIEERHIPLHLSVLFTLLREDCSRGLKNAMHVFTEATQMIQSPFENQKILRKTVSELDKKRNTHPMFDIACTGPSFHMEYGIVFSLRVPGRNGRQQRGLMPGNLLALGAVGNNCIERWLMGLIVPVGVPAKEQQKTTHTDINFFLLNGDSGTDSFNCMRTATTFVGLESSAFYCSYASALKVLSEFCRSPTLPLFRPLFEIRSNDTPFYLEDRRLDITGLIALKDGFEGLSNPRDLGCWKDACRDWTLEEEKSLKEKSSTDPSFKYCHVMDETQRVALHHIFNHRVAIVQGTPGTGKSFIAVKAIEILHNSRNANRVNEVPIGPIVVMALTNHAVDDVLADLLEFFKSSTHDPDGNNVKMLRLGCGTRLEALKRYKYPPGTFSGTRKLHEFQDTIKRVKATSYLEDDKMLRFGSFLRLAQLNAIKEALYPLRLRPSMVTQNVSAAIRNVALSVDIDETDTAKLREILLALFVDASDTPTHLLLNALERADPYTRCDTQQLTQMWSSSSAKKDCIHDFLWKSVTKVPQSLANLLDKLSHLLSEQEKRYAEKQNRKGVNRTTEHTSNNDDDSGDDNDAVAQYENDQRNTRAADLVNVSAESMYTVHTRDTETLSEEIFRVIERCGRTADNFMAYGDFTVEQRTTFLKAVQIMDDKKVRQTLGHLMSPQLRREIALSKLRTIRNKVEHMKEMWVIGGTVNGVLTELESIRSLKPRVLIVEEAAEVQEGHTLAALTESVEHLILIGDHKQLSPQAEEIELRRKNMEVSLQERLILSKSDYVTLTTQRRMHPFISQVVHPYYLYDKNQPVQIVDHPSTEAIPCPEGIRDGKRGYLISYSLEAVPTAQERFDEFTMSYYNEYEADLILAMVTHLVRYNPGKEVIVLVAYAKQRQVVSHNLKEFSKFVRLCTIDDFQGEEGDFVLISTVRTEKPGFLSNENRACVALSRARMAFYVVGYEPMLQKACGVYQNMVKVLRENDCVGETFPAVCPEHNFTFDFTTMQKYRKNLCREKCGYKLRCGHACPAACHSTTAEAHRNFKCMYPCERVGTACRKTPRHCEHRCERLCFEDCPPCTKLVPYTCADCGHLLNIKCCTLHEDPDGIHCENMVTVPPDQTLCGHSIEVRCYISRAPEQVAKHCKEPCGHYLPCNHLCRLPCHMTTDIAAFEKTHADQCKDCTEVVDVVLPCGHKGYKPCNVGVSKFHCSAACGVTLTCGHVCIKKRCGHAGPHLCEKARLKVCNVCNNSFPVQCSEFETAKCPRTCGATLPCGHICKAFCGECRADPQQPIWAQHASCKGCCDKALPCGHRCKDGCGVSPCGPCKSACTFWCGHGRPCDVSKPHVCSECPAMRCNEPCLWSCPHHQCKKRCHEPCDRPVCDEACPLKLPCGHPCPGVCGEVCPKHCTVCYRKGKETAELKPPHFNDLSIIFTSPEEVEQFLRGEGVGNEEEDMRLVELPCCSTLTVVCVLDQYVASKEKEREEGCISVNNLLVKCPFTRPDGAPCGQPFQPWYYRRWSRVMLHGFESLNRLNDELRKREQEHKDKCSKCVQQWAHSIIKMLYPTDDKRISVLQKQYDDASASTLLLSKDPGVPEDDADNAKGAKRNKAINAAEKKRKRKDTRQIEEQRDLFFEFLFRRTDTKTHIPLSDSCEGMLRLLFFHSERVQTFFTERFFIEESGESPKGGQQRQSKKDLLPYALTLGLHVLDLQLLRLEATRKVVEQMEHRDAHELDLFEVAEKKYIENAFHTPLNPQYRREISLQSWVLLLQLCKASCALQVVGTHTNREALLSELACLRAKFRVDQSFFIGEESGCSQPAFLTELQELTEPILKRAEPIIQLARSDVPSPEFLRSIRAAMTGTPGHLYVCPKGHFYFIGECGGAMQESKCPDCGAKVGGKQHTSAAGNAFAGSYIDGNANVPWPGVPVREN